MTGGTTIGVSWPGFHEERWAKDERALRDALRARGLEASFAYVHGAAQDSRIAPQDPRSGPERQAEDIEAMLAGGVAGLLVLPQDKSTSIPVLRRAVEAKVPVVIYDRVLELPGAVYVSFDFREVGRQVAAAILTVQPRGDFVVMSGSELDPVTFIIRAGMMDVLQPAIDRGDVRVVGEAFTDGWLPENARLNMERLVGELDGCIDAVVAANDGTGLASADVLMKHGRRGVPISGHDGDERVLRYIGNGLMTVCAWKDARRLAAEAARLLSSLIEGVPPHELPGRTAWIGPGGATMDAVLLPPVPITRDNIDLVISSGWTTRDNVFAPVP